MRNDPETKRYLLIVQAEGRGHLTQAITVYNFLVKHKQKVCHTILGENSGKVPDSLVKKIHTPITKIPSPKFSLDKKNRKVHLVNSVLKSILNIPNYRRGCGIIDNIIVQKNIDVIINFYEFIGGLYFLLKKPKNVIHIAIGHQYFLDHPNFKFPRINFLNQFLLNAGNKITSFGACKKLFLSFYKQPDFPDKKLYCLPPIIREKIFKLNSVKEGYYLVYMVNHGYSNEIIEYAKKNPSVNIQCFWDNYDLPSPYQPNDNLTFWHIQDELFVEALSKCRGYLSTAGFESICEAVFLDKPIVMMPAKGQYEQECNAKDASENAIGTISKNFDLKKLIEISEKFPFPENVIFKKWVKEKESLLIKHLL